MHDLIARILIVVHKLISGRPAVQRRLAGAVNASVGEKRVNAAILELTRPGDVVWDVGANVGAYVTSFLERVGDQGHVVAIEPVPSNAAQLALLGSRERLTVVEAALATTDGEMSLVVSGESGETSSIGDGPGALHVRVARGDTLLSDGIPQPQIVKIDVEGFERDVLEGMSDVLPAVRSVIVEVHFAAMARRGRQRDAVSVMALLRRNGLAPRWVDPSHLVATR